MSDITPAKKLITNEEVDAYAAVSNATGNRLGGCLNFHNYYQFTTLQWNLNGKYGRATGGQQGVDGAVPVFWDCEIVGFFMFNSIEGTSGTTEINIRRFTSSGGSGSTIFVVRPSITSASGSNAYLSAYYDPIVTLENPSGTVMPVFTSRQLNRGDALVLDFTSRQAAAESLTVTLALRPR